MSGHCELCGARWDEDATRCRDCGAPPRAPVPPTAPVLIGSPHTAETSPASIPMPLPAMPTAQVRERKRLPLILAAAGVGVVLVAGLVAILVSDSDEPSSPSTSAAVASLPPSRAANCGELDQLAGSWRFTTITTGARKDKRLGVREFYELEVTLEDCTARAALSKVGRDGREPFEEHKVPRAYATLSPGEGIDAFGQTATFELRNQEGDGSGHRFVFAREGDRLVGSWRHTAKRWRRQGQYGVLEGSATADPQQITPSRDTQPCAVQCVTPLDSTPLYAPADHTSLVACIDACR
ncbi:MAG: hypothetical protein K0V04_21805 [Deltaproteobacteria bacterium]|nr:hypothetical protein [Deltaproteobacteria bacterium]